MLSIRKKKTPSPRSVRKKCLGPAKVATAVVAVAAVRAAATTATAEVHISTGHHHFRQQPYTERKSPSGKFPRHPAEKSKDKTRGILIFMKHSKSEAMAIYSSSLFEWHFFYLIRFWLVGSWSGALQSLSRHSSKHLTGNSVQLHSRKHASCEKKSEIANQRGKMSGRKRNK